MRATVFSLFAAAALTTLVLFFSNSDSSRQLFPDLLVQGQTLSPAINGRVVVGDISLANVKITRTLSIGQQKFVSQVVTDANGQFSFQEMTSKEPLLGESTNRLWQDISLSYDGNDYVLWYTAIDHEMDNFIVRDALSSLACNLESSENEFNISDKRRPGLPVSVYSICDIALTQKKATQMSG
ncbi:DUF6795 domain-containing protein [Pseudoalteromonas pernae]|uniref:DUF6795 domain-containing protein n=1 Tax=Pseudoalteromonas pernae TaxID=3118054 RepID=UPI0032424ED9